jgi:aromatic amino acid aminotransferase I
MASIEHGALVTCGSWFSANSNCQQSSIFFRATFAAAPFDQIEAAIKRFGEAVREVFGLEKQANRIDRPCNGQS